MDSGNNSSLDSFDEGTSATNSGNTANYGSSPTGSDVGNATDQTTENGITTAGDANTEGTAPATKEEIGDDSQTATGSGNSESVYFGTFGLITAIFSVIIIIISLISLWKIFEKAGEKGFKVLIPIYNLFILVKIAFSKNDLSSASNNGDTFNFEDNTSLNNFNSDGYMNDSNRISNGFDMSGHLNSEFAPNNEGIQSMNQMNPGFNDIQSEEQINNNFVPPTSNEQINNTNEPNYELPNQNASSINNNMVPNMNNGMQKEINNNMNQNMMGPSMNNNEVNNNAAPNNNQPYNNGPMPINGTQGITKQCPNCHAPVPLNLVICPNCGANINK